MGSGLGSSASLCSALSTGFYHILRCIDLHEDINWEKKLEKKYIITTAQRKVINHWAFEGERIIQGTPSGVDNSCVVYGGVVSFRRHGTEIDLDFLPSGIIPSTIKILITNTKQPKNTKMLVAGVHVLKNKYPMVIEPIFHSIEQITQHIITTLTKSLQSKQKHKRCDNNGDDDNDDVDVDEEEITDNDIYQKFYDLLFINQHLLNAIGVGHPKIDQIINISRSFPITDTFITKLTGAGGGGCVITLSNPNNQSDVIEEFTKKCTSHGFDVIETVMGQQGVLLAPLDPNNL
jgi:mevalonate kinase